MKTVKKRVAGLFLLLIILFGLCIPVGAADDGLESAAEQSAAYLLNTVQAPQIGSMGGEWVILGLARSGYDVPQSYWEGYYGAVERETASRKGVLDGRKYTEYSRVAIALTALGADPTDVAGYDLLAPLGDFEKTVWQGINGPIWALIALDAGNYDMPVNEGAGPQATRQMYVDEILSRQLVSGGWSFTGKAGDSADADLTGMALQALAKYQAQPEVKAAVERALDCLSAMQEADGGYSSYGVPNAESAAQVVVALCELGIGLDDPRFVKNGCSLLDSLMSYRESDGSFCHGRDGSGSNQMATEQGFYALVAALRAAQGKNSLYQMGDAPVRLSGYMARPDGLPGKHGDVKRAVISDPGVSFPDLDGGSSQAAVEALAARGIIRGFDDGTFGAGETMTRAQFAAVVVRGLGLPLQKRAAQFTDVEPDAWYAPFVGAASAYGIVQGKTADGFDPEGTITRQEAAVMTARAAALCGMDVELEEPEILDTLSRFGDRLAVVQWAREDVAFCCREGILAPSGEDVEPERAILRGEVAQMLYNLLDSAKLL